MLGTYLKFTELFSKLSPYELNHLSEVWLCKIELLSEGKLQCTASGYTLTGQDLKFALIEAMRDIVIDLNRREINQQQMRLSQTMSQIFVTDSIAA